MGCWVQTVKHPRKRLYRARAHSNPLNDAHFPVPAHPDAFNWYSGIPSFVFGLMVLDGLRKAASWYLSHELSLNTFYEWIIMFTG